MKLLVDENLAPRLVGDLADLFRDSLHISSAELGSTPDAVIWEYAKEHGFTFLTKDKDFASLSIAWGAPPKVVLLPVTAPLRRSSALSDATPFDSLISKTIPGEAC